MRSNSLKFVFILSFLKSNYSLARKGVSGFVLFLVAGRVYIAKFSVFGPNTFTADMYDVYMSKYQHSVRWSVRLYNFMR